MRRTRNKGKRPPQRGDIFYADLRDTGNGAQRGYRPVIIIQNNIGIPAQDTTYAEATTTAAGLMSAADKEKLDGMELATDTEVTEMLNEVFTTSGE